MARTLPAAEVVRKYIDEDFDIHSPVMVLQWPEDAGERLWELPEGLSLLGCPPRSFGLVLKRSSADTYTVRLNWERTQLHWPALTRVELLGSCLAPLLAALGLDLWAMLEQPVSMPRFRHRAA